MPKMWSYTNGAMGRMTKGPKRLKEACIWAYFAGIIDGEGCLSCTEYVLRGKKQGHQLHFSVRNTDVRLIDWLVTNFGGYVQVATQTNPRAKVGFLWSPKACSIILLLEQALPYLVLKKEQARLFIKFRKLMVTPGKPLTKANRKSRELIYKRMQKLNRRGRL